MDPKLNAPEVDTATRELLREIIDLHRRQACAMQKVIEAHTRGAYVMEQCLVAGTAPSIPMLISAMKDLAPSGDSIFADSLLLVRKYELLFPGLADAMRAKTVECGNAVLASAS